jgi:hypothetical protein
MINLYQIFSDQPPRQYPTATASGVYLIKADKYYKIGCSRDVYTRFNSIYRTLPFEAVLLHHIPCSGYERAEAALHTRYKDKLVKNEWFLLNDQDVEEIKALKSLKDDYWL